MAERGKGFEGQRGHFRGGRSGRRGVTRGPTGHKLIQLTIDLGINTYNYLEWRKSFLVEEYPAVLNGRKFSRLHSL